MQGFWHTFAEGLGRRCAVCASLGEGGGMSNPMDVTQNVELKLAFLKHLPKRLETLYRRVQRLSQGGWDINAMSQLFSDVQALTGTCGRYGLVELGQNLYALEQVLGDLSRGARLPDQIVDRQILDLVDELAWRSDSETESLTQHQRGATPPANDVPAPFDKAPEVEAVAQVTREDPFVSVASAAAAPPAPTPFVAPAVALPTAVDDEARVAAARLLSNVPLTATPLSAATRGRAGGGFQLRTSALRIYHLSSGDGPAELACAELAAAGDTVETLNDPEEMAEMIGAIAPHLVIVDTAFGDALPLLGAAIAAAREHTRHRVFMIVLAARQDVTLRLAAMRAGADVFLPPPVDARDVLVRARALLETRNEAPFRVLIVEDDRAQSMFAESILRKAGVETLAVLEALEALDVLEEFGPELILMDLNMPGCDGIELTTLIRERERFLNTPIVFLSGEQDSERRFDALNVGGDDYLTKPIRPKHLISAVTNRIRRARQLQKRVQTRDPRDEVTGLFERAYLLDRISEVLAGEPRDVGALMFCRLHGAEREREKHGVLAFDALITQAGALLTSQVAATDLVARFGEDTFVIYQPEAEPQQAKQFAASLRDTVGRNFFDVEGRAVLLRVAIGIAPLAVGWIDLGSLLNAADRAATKAMSDSNLAPVLFAPPIATRDAPALDVGQLMRDALRYDAFQLVFQPIASLRGETEEQFQVLLRLAAPDGRMLLATDLIPEAERSGLIADIDRWVLSRTLAILQERTRNLHRARLFVSQSAQALQDPERVQALQQMLEARRIEPELLTIELKLVLVANMARTATAFTAAIRALGCRVCLSGVEATPAHLEFAELLSLDYLKMSATYVAGANRDAKRREDLQKLVNFARERGLRVIAPMVEDASTAALLWSTGVDFMQGNFVQQATRSMDFDFSAGAL